MRRIVWNVYRQFRCIAEKCPDSCCQGWEVDIDPQTAADYQNRGDDLAQYLKTVMQTQDGNTCMTLQNGRCPMWREDGLCRIHAQWGHDALCQVCREYPRLYMDYGDFVQWGLELSCPEAARLIFRGLTAETQEIPHAGAAEYDRELMDILQRSREELLNFWQDTTLSVPDALAVTLLFGHQTQGTLDGGQYETLDPAACLQAARKYAGAGDMPLLLAFFGELEILTDRWRKRLSDPTPGAWTADFRMLISYLIRRYWFQAVWDFDLVCRVKFMVAACLVVYGVGGDVEQTAQLFAKEIENDPDNREAIFDAAYTHPAFTDANLLGLLLNKKGQ